MTTPQNQLYTLSQRIWDLYKLFQPDDEEDDSIFERVKQIELQIVDLMASHQRIENLLNLVIKLLGKHE
jgi:hypothetical protein